ncbi:MAG: SAM-dependent methyltransferase [Pseudonocardiaceae bacterium]
MRAGGDGILGQACRGAGWATRSLGPQQRRVRSRGTQPVPIMDTPGDVPDHCWRGYRQQQAAVGPDLGLVRFFEGTELLDPGVVSCSRWRPDPIQVGTRQAEVYLFGGVGRIR